MSVTDHLGLKNEQEIDTKKWRKIWQKSPAKNAEPLAKNLRISERLCVHIDWSGQSVEGMKYWMVREDVSLHGHWSPWGGVVMSICLLGLRFSAL